MSTLALERLWSMTGVTDELAAQTRHVVGRGDVLDRISSFLRAIGSGPASLTISGEPGMGRTTLWLHTVAAARELGYHVLTVQASAEERAVPGAGLKELFRDDRDVLGEPDDLTDPVLDLGRRVLAGLSRFAADAPVVVAVDNCRRLDPTSADALRFALHRLIDERVGTLCTVGSVAPGPVDPLGLHYGDHVDLEPLPIDLFRKVLGRRLPTMSRPELLRVHELSRGNPGLALRLVRSRRGECLGRSMSATLADFSTETRKVLIALALAGPSAAGVVASAAAVNDFAAAARVAVESGAVVVSDDLVMRFRDPQVAQDVLTETNPLDRCAVHARLAATATDREARARHLALASLEADETVATELEQVADQCAARGSSEVAAELTAHAVRLTPAHEVDAATRRASAEIMRRAAAGETAGALHLADELLRRLPSGARRAQVLAQRVFLDLSDSEGLLLQTLHDVQGDDGWRARVLDLLGWLYGHFQGRLVEGMAQSSRALELARRRDDAEVTVLAAATLAATSALSGRPRPELFAEALAGAASVRLSPLGRWPAVFWARDLLWSGHLADARAVLVRMQRDALARGSEYQRPYRLADLAAVEVAAGDLGAARRCAAVGIDAAMDAGNEQAIPWLAHPLGLAAALQGEVAVASWAARRLADWAITNDEPPRRAMAEEILGNQAATAGDWAAAADHFSTMVRQLDTMGYQHPGARPGLSRAIEAASMIGDVQAVEAMTDRLAAQAAAFDAPLPNALLLAAQGQFALIQNLDPVPALTAAIEQLDRLGYRFEAARVRLQLARALLRSGQRNNAGVAAVAAASAFEFARAPAWVAVAESLRIRADATVSPPPLLTRTETQVANSVAAGRTNREIAKELFIGISTVEAHLTRIYRKLQLRHRTELVAWIQSGNSILSTREQSA